MPSPLVDAPLVPRVLIAEDDAVLAKVTSAYLSRSGWEVERVGDGEAAVARARSGDHDVLLLDIRLPGIDGLDVLDAVRQHGRSRPAVVMLSGHLDVETTLVALRRGADEILEKPVEPRGLLKILDGVYERVRDRAAGVGSGFSSDAVSELLGRSPSLCRLRDQIAEVAAHVDQPVLIVGETGTGKELVARALHRLSGADGPLVAINCAAVAPELFESELFGHEPGAFTGARGFRTGLLQAAGTGTLFLDEVGEMPLRQQAKLLRVLETRSFRRVGSDREVPFRARVVSATNRSLRGRRDDPIRPDLYFRLSGQTLRTPPLRQRREDIAPLACHFLAALADDGTVLPTRLSPGAAQALEDYDWPGNVRELKALVRSAAQYAQSETLGLVHVVEALRDRGCLEPRSALPPPLDGQDEAGLGTLREQERKMVARAYAEAQGNLSLAARRLGIPRSTLRGRLERYGLK